MPTNHLIWTLIDWPAVGRVFLTLLRLGLALGRAVWRVLYTGVGAVVCLVLIDWLLS